MIRKKKVGVFTLIILLGEIILLFVIILIKEKKHEVSFTQQALPLVNKFTSAFEISAKSAIIIDADSGTVLYQKDPHQRLHPASITKMATAIIALETYPMDEVIEIKNSYKIGRNMGLIDGEKITVEGLIYGILVHSANDAAYVLAGQDPRTIKNFIERMNSFIKEVGLKDTHFVNFDGEDDEDHYSSAWDLAQLARRAIRNDIFLSAVGKKEVIIKDVSGENEHQLETTNQLLGITPEVSGIKTGWTPIVGECFVGLIDLKGHKIITVILGSTDRFGETRKMIDWLKEAVSWEELN